MSAEALNLFHSIFLIFILENARVDTLSRVHRHTCVCTRSRMHHTTSHTGIRWTYRHTQVGAYTHEYAYMQGLIHKQLCTHGDTDTRTHVAHMVSCGCSVMTNVVE